MCSNFKITVAESKTRTEKKCKKRKREGSVPGVKGPAVDVYHGKRAPQRHI